MVSLSNFVTNGVVSLEQVSEEMRWRNSGTGNEESQVLFQKIEEGRDQETKVMQTRPRSSRGQGRIFFATTMMKKGTSRAIASIPRRIRRKIGRRC